MLNVQTCAHTWVPLYPAHVNSECDSFVLGYHPFETWIKGVLYRMSSCYCSSDVGKNVHMFDLQEYVIL